MRIKYFAFGSNIGAEQMTRRCPSATCAGRAVLLDHKLVFAGSSSTWGGNGVANATPEKGSAVLGRMWLISRKDLYTLDGYEGHPVAYKRVKMSIVTDIDGTSEMAWVYVKQRNAQIRPPSNAYVWRIADGLADAGYPLDSEAFKSLADAVIESHGKKIERLQSQIEKQAKKQRAVSNMLSPQELEHRYSCDPYADEIIEEVSDFYPEQMESWDQQELYYYQSESLWSYTKGEDYE